MTNTTLNYTNATQLLEQGKDKDAYAAFLSVVELSTQQLHQVKFVHQTIVSKPLQYEDSIALLRSSLDQLEKIAIHKLPGAMVIKKTTAIMKSPPPVPPKPSTIVSQKPTIPPKPKKIMPNKRSRGNSVSFADNLQQTTIIENDQSLNFLSAASPPPHYYPPSPPLTINTKQEVLAAVETIEEDDDDDDDVVIEFETAPVKTTKRPSTVITTNYNQTFPPPQRLRDRSKSWVVQSDSSSKKDSIDVLLETIVDPCKLVPAQTNTGDSLAIPNTTQTPSYVPNIPAPPLLATHRRLQQRLDELESDVEECDNDLLKLERSHKLICARQTLEKVRTLYMSAMTIPNILQFPPHLMAYQLTLIESSIFRDIPRQALLSHSARTPHRKIVASTDFFNFMTRSIEHSILLPQEASKRSEIIHRWIKIATKLLALNNYQTLKAIVSALGTPPVQRLKRTWECIPKKRMGRLDLLNSLMSETDNYSKYREHMGLEKRRLWAKPVVPFLGVFIHDVTYLYAAAKGNPDDVRVQDVLNNVQLFQRAPEYPQHPPTSLSAIKKHHLFRPSLHFGSSSTKNTNRVTTAALMGEDQRQETEIELEQQLIVQYILMRPWVSEKTIDALSTLREPAKPRSISSPTASSTNGSNSPNSTISSKSGGSRPSSFFLVSPSVSSTITSASPITNGSNLSMNNGSSSILSNASSFIRFNSNNSSNNNSNSSIDDTTTNEESKRSLGGFWPFRKSTDISNRSSMSTYDAVVFISQEQSWSEEEEEVISHRFTHGHLLQPKSNEDGSKGGRYLQ